MIFEFNVVDVGVRRSHEQPPHERPLMRVSLSSSRGDRECPKSGGQLALEEVRSFFAILAPPFIEAKDLKVTLRSGEDRFRHRVRSVSRMSSAGEIRPWDACSRLFEMALRMALCSWVS